MTKEKYKGILFLDMDGVLCTPRMHLVKGPGTFNYLDPVCVQLLDRFCQDHKLHLVCSSAWRHNHRVPDILASHGMLTRFVSRSINDLNEYPYEICNTPRHNTKEDTSRGSEILHWLKDHSDKMEDPNRFIIFDDEITDIISHESLSSHTVKCDMYNGITWEAYHAAEKIMWYLDGKDMKGS